MYYGINLPPRSLENFLHFSFSASTSSAPNSSSTYFNNRFQLIQISYNYYSRYPYESRHIRPPMDVSTYMGLLVPGNNYTWPDSRRFASMCVNIDDVNAEIVTEKGHENMSAAGGWLKRWSQLDYRCARSCATTGLCDML